MMPSIAVAFATRVSAHTGIYRVVLIHLSKFELCGRVNNFYHDSWHRNPYAALSPLIWSHVLSFDYLKSKIIIIYFWF